jgi:hypothetical protein
MLAVTLTVAGQDSEQGKKKKKGKGPADPPRTTLYMNQLRALFARWDTNKDDFLDKKELAVAFRGAGARPFDAGETKATAKEDSKADEKKDEDKKDEKKDTSAKDKAGKTPDYSKYPDYQFLTQLDKDRDDQVSRDEFLEWGREYAMQLRDQKELNDSATKLQQRIGKTKPRSKERRSLESQLKQQQQQINKLQQQLRRYERIQRSLR